MKMDDEKLKRILQEGMEYEADCIMAEVDSDPKVKDAIAPEDLHTNLMKQIKEHEEEVERERQNQAEEEKELIRLGKIYKKKRARRKYIILIAAVVCALAVGTISFGDGKKVFSDVKGLIQDLKYTRISKEGEGKIAAGEAMEEEEAFESVKEKFGFYPVRLSYLPDGMNFVEIVSEENLQFMQLYYADGKDKSISYRITTNYRTGSIGVEIEDMLANEYDKELNGMVIHIKEYKVEENNTKRWVISFIYNDAQYSLLMMGIEEREVENIIENLYFF